MTIFQDIESKEWILLVLGAFIPYLISFIGYLRKYVSTHKNISHLFGEWHSYHWSRVNSCSEFRYDIWNIKHNLFSGLTLTQKDSKKGSLEYSGKLRYEGGHAVMEFVAKKHRQESWIFRAIDPIPVPNGNTIIRGIVLAQDFDRKIFSSVYIVSREPVAEKDVKILLHTFTDHGKDLSLRLKECFSEDEEKYLGNFYADAANKSMQPTTNVSAD